MKILVTGAAGFIGFHTSKLLAEAGHDIIGLDNINDYYDVNLKYARLNELGFESRGAIDSGELLASNLFEGTCAFLKMSLENEKGIAALFAKEKFDAVCHLGAQAGVRYSLENPLAYIESNIVGFLNILEGCRNTKVKHLVYASSSSVYGLNSKIPFSTGDRTDKPISLYAATKKSNELMAFTYSHLYGFKSTGLRFFTVYGPWGRPDMAIYLFTEAIQNNQPIKVFNHGNMKRDFTYVDDIVEGVTRIVTSTIDDYDSKVYNIGNSTSEKLIDFIEEIEKNLNKKAVKKMMPIQPGDVEKTWADVSALEKDFNYCPNTSIEKGIRNFVDWYKNYTNK